MVYFGKPSRGCANCRKLHTKCDEGQPACSRCVKSGKTCDGYRDQSQLIFRDETAKTRGKVHQKRILKQSQAAQAVSSFTIPGGLSAPFYNTHISITRTLCSSKEDIAISHFYNSTADNLPNADPTRHLHQRLPPLYFQSQQGSVLRLAVEATSYACATKLIPQATQLSSKCYIKALNVLQTALQDPNLRFSDETLYGVLLLCGFETVKTKWKQPSLRSAWGSHVDGAAALIKARGISDLHSSLFNEIFCFVRKKVVLGQMQISKPVDKAFLKHIMSSHEDTEDRLISLAARVPQLQYTSCQLDTSNYINKTEAKKLLSDVTELDLELSIWARSMSPKWSYATAVNINSHARIDYTPHVIHRYADRYIARVWNLYRVSRLIIQSILLRTTTCLIKGPSDEVQIDEIKRVIARLVDDICASVPYLLGHDLSNMSLAVDNSDGRRVNDHGTSSVNATSGTSAPIGGFSLIWPLSVACSAFSVPDAQREWMQRQLQLLTHHDEPLTSTILSGKPNEFRFDCV